MLAQKAWPRFSSGRRGRLGQPLTQQSFGLDIDRLRPVRSGDARRSPDPTIPTTSITARGTRRLRSFRFDLHRRLPPGSSITAEGRNMDTRPTDAQPPASEDGEANAAPAPSAGSEPPIGTGIPRAPNDDNDETRAGPVPWRKNILWLFGLAFLAGGAMLCAELTAEAMLDDYDGHMETVLEYFKIIGIGAIALAKDLR